MNPRDIEILKYVKAHGVSSITFVCRDTKLQYRHVRRRLDILIGAGNVVVIPLAEAQALKTVPGFELAPNRSNYYRITEAGTKLLSEIAYKELTFECPLHEATDASGVGTRVIVSKDGKIRRVLHMHLEVNAGKAFPYPVRLPKRPLTSVFDLALA